MGSSQEKKMPGAPMYLPAPTASFVSSVRWVRARVTLRPASEK